MNPRTSSKFSEDAGKTPETQKGRKMAKGSNGVQQKSQMKSSKESGKKKRNSSKKSPKKKICKLKFDAVIYGKANTFSFFSAYPE